MKIVKISSPELGYPLQNQNVPLRQTKNSTGIWGDYKFIINQDIDECDYWVVFDQVQRTETCRCPKQNTIFITGEPPEIGSYPTKFLNQFQNIITCHWDILTNRNIYGNKINYIQGHIWFVNKTYDELINIPRLIKPKLLSLITTKKYTARYEFALKLKEHFEDRLDLFGAGINPVKNKWDALSSYKYSIVLENFKNANWITEKLFDSYLAQTYPFYYGCNNVNIYYPVGSYSEIDINYPEYSIDIIERILDDNDHYNSALPYLDRAKDLTLNNYNLFPLIINKIQTNHLLSNRPKQEITISDKYRFFKNVSMFFNYLRLKP